jgi:hypothetical protein
MKYLNITKSTEVTNPNDGHPYVYYNDDISKVWIFLGLKWILENGRWNNDKSWDSTGRWNYYGKPIGV